MKNYCMHVSLSRGRGRDKEKQEEEEEEEMRREMLEERIPLRDGVEARGGR